MRRYTRDHGTIAEWARQRGAIPARVRGAPGVLRLAFGPLPRNWEAIDWQTFFRAFDDEGLVLLYEDAPGSRICKLVRATLADEG